MGAPYIAMHPIPPVVLSAVLLTAATTSLAGAEQKPVEKKPFTARDLVMMERVSDPRVSPDGRYVAYQVRKTDLEANKGLNGIWLLDLKTPAAVPRLLTTTGN